MTQGWKNVVDEIEGTEPDEPIVYDFTHGDNASQKEGTGVFKARKSHGAYDGDN